MVQQTPSKALHREEFVRASINQAGFKLEISSKDAANTLTELRRIMECLSGVDEGVDEFTSFELSTSLSEEFMANNAAMAEIKRLLSLEQQYRIVKEHISAVEEIDLIAGKKQLRVEGTAIKRSINNLFSCTNTCSIKHALVHIKGLIAEHERMVIIDRIHERIPHAHVRAYHTDQDIQGKILVEALVFGDFEQEE